MKKETDLVKECLAYLKLKGIMAWRNNTGGTVSEYKGRKRFTRFGQPGSVDILGILPYGQLLAVECKVGKNKLTAIQEDWLSRAKEHGAKVIVAYSLDDVMSEV